MPALLSATSYYSLMRGVHAPSALCRAARRLGYDAVALTDIDNLYGLPDFLIHCERNSLRPIIASTLTRGASRAILYAGGDDGYASLCRVISRRHCDKEFDAVSALRESSGGLRAVTSDISFIESLRDYLPVYYRMSTLRRVPEEVKKLGIESLIIPEAVFLNEHDAGIRRLLRAIDCNTTLSRARADDPAPGDCTLTGWTAVRRNFEVFDKELDATERFGDSIRSRTDFTSLVMPRFSSDRPALQLLREKAFAGASQRYPALTTAVNARLEYELDLIGRKGFAPYFLVVDDIVKQSPRTCGRGSGAASIVCYCLGITNVDPIRYNLMFERFISPNRIDPPDIDVDFAWDERDRVLEYVFKKYGHEHAAMVAVHLTFGARMALRETARVYGFSESEISAVTKKIPHYFEMTANGFGIASMLSKHPRTSHLPLDAPWPDIIAQAERLFGIPCGIGTHCGGVVITGRPIRSAAPVQISAKGYPIVQWEKDGTEQMGLVKIDLLGNRSLAVIRDALSNLRSQSIAIDERTWDPASDTETQTMLARGTTMGVFYVESPAMRLLQKKTGRGDFEHMVIHSSIIRPAANKYISEYIRRLNGGAYTVEHPALNELLSETFGILVYQEDVAKTAMAIAGFSFEEADALRKIISKKDRYGKLNDFRERFVAGAAKNGTAPDSIERIWEMCLSFAGYSFCKPHSASYVQVSFQSAWLRAHYPAAFLAAVLGNYGGFYITQAYVSEAQRMGITVLGPDVNGSRERYWAEIVQKPETGCSGGNGGSSIRVGLCQVKGLSGSARGRIIRERRDNGRYISLPDFLGRAEITEPDAERLILAGACDSLEPSMSRSQIFWCMRAFFRGSHVLVVPPQLRPWPRLKMLRAQYRMLGYLTELHPLLVIAGARIDGAVKIGDMVRHLGQEVLFAGWCITSRTAVTAQGEAMQFVTFEDETGTCECVMFPEVYLKFVRLVGWKEAFSVRGRVQEEFGALTVNISRLEPMRV